MHPPAEAEIEVRIKFVLKRTHTSWKQIKVVKAYGSIADNVKPLKAFNYFPTCFFFIPFSLFTG
jgi:hypothetical protein